MPRDHHLSRALKLSWLSICFGTVSGVVSVDAGLSAHSLGVLASGLSVLADVTGSIVLIWRFRTERVDPHRGEVVERRAALAVAATLVIIGVVLAFDSIRSLIQGTHPESSLLAIVTSGVSILVLYPLAYAKRLTAIALNSHALRGDASLSAIGASTALLALVGLLLFKAFGWWWSDRVVALLIAIIATAQARAVLVAAAAED
jgi:divalent metal cation (Fe/Co/Zn/Cd) transporter